MLGVAAPGQCLWGGGLPWLHVLGCDFYIFLVLISLCLLTCVMTHFMFWCGTFLLRTFIGMHLLVTYTHHFYRLCSGLIFPLVSFQLYKAGV